VVWQFGVCVDGVSVVWSGAVWGWAVGCMLMLCGVRWGNVVCSGAVWCVCRAVCVVTVMCE
jgi:hypothetical protein